MIELTFYHLSLPCKDGVTIIRFSTWPSQTCLQGAGLGWPLLRVWDIWACPDLVVARWHYLAIRTKWDMPRLGLIVMMWTKASHRFNSSTRAVFFHSRKHVHNIGPVSTSITGQVKRNTMLNLRVIVRRTFTN